MALEDELKELRSVVADGFRTLAEAIDKRFGELSPVATEERQQKPLTRDDIKKQIMKPLTADERGSRTRRSSGLPGTKPEQMPPVNEGLKEAIDDPSQTNNYRIIENKLGRGPFSLRQVAGCYKQGDIEESLEIMCDLEEKKLAVRVNTAGTSWMLEKV